jgi:PKD repeat protein
MAFRTNYYDVDYITEGGYAPVGPFSAICIVGQNNAQIQITPRSWADMTIPTVADFMADKTFVLTGENVIFMDMSTNHPSSWEWTFEGGTPATSTEQNPVVTYAAKGTYAVTLKATNPSGVSNTVTKTDYISIGVVGIPTTSAVVTIYPNPTSGMLYITNPTKGLQTVEIFNTVGKQVNSVASSKESISVDLTGQDRGMYLVKITNNETKTVQYKKIVVR